MPGQPPAASGRVPGAKHTSLESYLLPPDLNSLDADPPDWLETALSSRVPFHSQSTSKPDTSEPPCRGLRSASYRQPKTPAYCRNSGLPNPCSGFLRPAAGLG